MRLGVLLLALCVILAATAASALGTVYVRDSTKRYKVHPDRLTFVVGAGTFVKFSDLQPWHRWARPRTNASGTEHYNDCKPSCADGHIRTTPAKVRLKHIRICHGHQVYSRIRSRPKNPSAPAIVGHITCRGNVR